MRDTAGKVAFITGGSSGIGLGIARAFTDAGMRVAITYRSKDNLDEAMAHLRQHGDRVHAMSLDVTDRAAVEAACEEVVRVFGKMHVVVANAGVGLLGPISAASYEDWDWGIGVNLNGVFNTVHCALPRIRSHGEGGHVIAVSSIGGLLAHGWCGVYTAAKFAVVGMMEALRNELAGSDIGVTVFCPGPVNSKIVDSARNRPGGPPATPAGPPGSDADRPPPEILFAGMDALEAGERVLRGMRDNDLYVLTTPEFESELRARGEAILASLPTDVVSPPARVAFATMLLGPTDYIRERDRMVRQRAGTLSAGLG